jgi:protein-S-isoprenylcysteine O-methyltransferase Ste14
MSSELTEPLGMGAPTEETPGPRRPSDLRLAVRGIARVGLVVGLCVWGGLSGWWQLWPVLGILILALGVNLTVIRLRNPGLLRERLKPDRPEKSWDKAILAVSLALFAAIVVVAWLDVLRYHWSIVPVEGMVAGALLTLVGDGIAAWCMAENPFLERTVRMQKERGHRVITTGPYRLVRHPMYVGIMVMYAGLTLLLGSYLALVPAILLDAMLIVRTYFEDRTLHEELEGYRDYATRTRYRLLPGVW